MAGPQQCSGSAPAAALGPMGVRQVCALLLGVASAVSHVLLPAKAWACGSAAAAAPGLANSHVAVGFGNCTTGFQLAELRGVSAASAAGNLLSEPRPSWWKVTLVLPGNITAVISSASPCNRSHAYASAVGSRTLMLSWASVSTGSGSAQVDVSANWTLRDRASTVELSAFTVTPSFISAAGMAAMWSLEFSLGLSLSTTDTLYVPFLYGLAFDDPGRTLYTSPVDNGWDGACAISTARFSTDLVGSLGLRVSCISSDRSVVLQTPRRSQPRSTWPTPNEERPAPRR
jgi:hypothetical protein